MEKSAKQIKIFILFRLRVINFELISNFKIILISKILADFFRFFAQLNRFVSAWAQRSKRDLDRIPVCLVLLFPEETDTSAIALKEYNEDWCRFITLIHWELKRIGWSSAYGMCWFSCGILIQFLGNYITQKWINGTENHYLQESNFKKCDTSRKIWNVVFRIHYHHIVSTRILGDSCWVQSFRRLLHEINF